MESILLHLIRNTFIPEIKDLTNFGIVNVLRDAGAGIIEGVNTDALAVEQIIDRYINSGVSDFRILGSGAMAEICQVILGQKLIKYQTYSRKQKNLGNEFEIKPKPDFATLLINTCSGISYSTTQVLTVITFGI